VSERRDGVEHASSVVRCASLVKEGRKEEGGSRKRETGNSENLRVQGSGTAWETVIPA
jgi:hypothetical protein